MKRLEISGRILARNTILNFFGRAAPLIVGIITIPFIINGLGKERFGLLSLVWVVLGHFTIFDLGLGRATTKYTAEALGRGEVNKVSHLVWTAVIIQAIFGIIGSIIVLSGTPLLVERVLNISTPLHAEARATFYVLALSVPIVLISSSFSGVLEATQRFDLLNIVRIPSSVATFVIPLIGGLLGWKLPSVIALLLIVKLIALIIFFVLDIKFIPEMKRPVVIKKSLLSQLFFFGGWITVSNLLAPFLRYLDRFMIGSLASTASIAYYSAPFDMMERLWIIPYSLVLTLFPAFSALSGLGLYKRTQKLFIRSIKFLIVVLTPLIFLLIIFGKQILSIWLGADFAQNSLIPLQILAIGALIGILAPVAGAIIQGYGRPDIVAKIYLVSFPLNFVLVWFLVKSLGLPGAALSFTLRTCCETLILIILTLRIIHLPIKRYLKSILNILIIIFLTGLSFWLTSRLSNVLSHIVAACIIIGLFMLLVWHLGFSEEDRTILRSLAKSRFI